MKTPARSALYLAVIWIIVIAVPLLRDVALVQVLGSRMVGVSLWPRRTRPSFFAKRSVWQKLAQQHPHDARLAIYALEASTAADVEDEDEQDDEEVVVSAPPPLSYPGAPQPQNNAYQLLQRAMLQSYDHLIARFGHDPLLPFLIAQRLKFTLNWMSPRRLAGELDQSYGARTSSGAAPERRAGRENFSARDLQTAVALCRRGQKLESDNAFFDWTLCKFLLIAWRDDEASRALAAASAKTRYDDHQTDEWRTTVAAQEIALGRPLLWEEKRRCLERFLEGNEYYYYQEPTGEFENEALSIIAWESLKAARRSDHTLALQLAGQAIRLAELQRKNSATFDERTMRANTELGLQNNLARDLMGWRGPAYYGYGGSNRKVAQSLGSYARNHGRADIARLAAQTRREASAILANAYTTSATARDFTYGFGPSRFVLFALSWIVGVLLLFSLSGSALGLVWLAFAACWRRFWDLLQMEASSFDRNEEALARREIIGGVLACSGARALGCVIAGAAGAGLCALGVGLVTARPGEVARALSDAYKSITAPGFWASFWPEFWSGLARSFSDLGDVTNYFRAAAVLLPLLLGVLYAQWRAVHRQRLQNGEGQEPRFWPLLHGLSTGKLFRAGFDYDFSRAFSKLLDWLLFLAFLAAWLTFAFWTDVGWWWVCAPIVALFFAGVLGLENIVRWRRRLRRREAARYQFHLLRASLWAWLLAASTLYLLLLLASSPLRRQADARMNQVLQYGTVKATQIDSAR